MESTSFDVWSMSASWEVQTTSQIHALVNMSLTNEVACGCSGGRLVGWPSDRWRSKTNNKMIEGKKIFSELINNCMCWRAMKLVRDENN